MSKRQGLESKNVKRVGQRLGPGARGVNVGRVGELGNFKGAHSEMKGDLPYRGEGDR
jgi:hypothetical protein